MFTVFCCCRDFLLKMGMCVEGLFHLILFCEQVDVAVLLGAEVFFCLKCFSEGLTHQ